MLERKGKLNFESGVFDPTIFGFVVVVMRTYFLRKSIWWKRNFLRFSHLPNTLLMLGRNEK